MNAPTLYAILGIKSDATPEQIKKAYHRLAKKYHPDMPGGSKERFRDINEAFEVLSDSERRAFYDKHGRIEERPPERNENADLYAIVQSAITVAMKQGQDPTTFDLIGTAVTMLKKDIQTMQLNKNQGDAELKRLRGIQARIIAKNGGENMLSKIFEQQISGVEAGITNAARSVEMAERAVEFFKNYEYKFDAPMQDYAYQSIQQRRIW